MKRVDLSRVVSGFLVLMVCVSVAAGTRLNAEEPKPAGPAQQRLRAGPEGAATAPQPLPSVIVPYDPEDQGGPGERTPERVYVDYDTFQKLWEDAKKNRREDDPEATIIDDNAPKDFAVTRALYRGSIEGKRLTIEGRLQVLTRGPEWQKVPLPFSGVDLSSLTLDGNPASYQGGAVMVEEPGIHEVVVRYHVRLPGGDEAASWKVPPATASLLAIELTGAAMEPVIGGGLPVVESAGEGGLRLFTAALGNRTDISFRTRLKTTGRGMTQPNVAEIDASLFLTPALERLEVDYDLQFQGHEESTFSIAFDQSITPVRLEIPNLASWRVTERDGLRHVDFELTRPVRDHVTVHLVGEWIIEEGALTNRPFPVLSADAVRFIHRQTFLAADRLAVKPAPGPSHRQTNIPASVAETPGFRPVASYTVTGDGALTYDLEEQIPERNARIDYVYQIGNDKLEIIAQLQLRSPEADLTGTGIALPPGSTIQSVQGSRIQEWWRTDDELFVRFSGPTPEVTPLLVYVTQELEGAPAEVSLPPFGLEDFPEVEGSALVTAHATVDSRLTLPQGAPAAREVNPAEVGQDYEILPPLERKRGFRFEQADFEATLTLTPIEPRYDVVWVMLAQANESWMTYSMLVDVEVSRSAINELTFSLPEDLPEVRVQSAELREVRSAVADGRRTYTVTFQRYVTDAVTFVLETEAAHAGEATLPFLEFPGAGRVEQYVVVDNASRDRINVVPENLEPTVKEQLPIQPSIQRTAQIFRARPGWSLNVSLERLETSAGNVAHVAWAELTTALRSNGEEWLKAVYHIQNRSLQFLPIVLPDDGELISVRVAGEPVRADQGEVDGREVTLIPLIQTKPGQLAYDVEVVLRSREEVKKDRNRRLKSLNRRLDDPELIGLTAESTVWHVYLPADHRLEDTDGNMDEAAERAALVQKIEGAIKELEGLNTLMRSKKARGEERIVALSNGRVLETQIESKLGDLETSLSYRGPDPNVANLRERFHEQKIILTENRIEMPVFQQQAQQEQREDEEDGVNWFFNAGSLLSRRSEVYKTNKEQLAKVESQMRLNDNISIGNTYWDEKGVKSAPAQPQPQKPEEEDAAKNKKGLYSKLAAGEQGAEVGKKLENLRYSQVGHLGTFQDTDAEGKPVVTPDESQGKTAQFIELDADRQKPAPAKGKVDAGQQAGQQVVIGGGFQGNARSSLEANEFNFTAPGSAVPVTAGQRSGSVDVSANSIDALIAEAAGQNGAVRIGGGFQGREMIQQQQLQGQLQAGGRISVAVDFPVEGEGHHFEKLKDHAWLQIESEEIEDSSRTWYAILGIAIGLILIMSDRLWQKRRARASNAAGATA